MVRLRVKEVAGAKKVSMHKLSRIADVSLTTIKKIYDNPYHSVTTNTLEKIARALNVAIHDLIEEEDL